MPSNATVWKDINGYEGLYQVSNFGEVKSLAHLVRSSRGNSYRMSPSRILKKGLIGRERNYYSVVLCKNGKTQTFLVHRLIAEAFIPNPNNLPQVNHIDENTKNNSISNLEWVTSKENDNHGTRNLRISNKQKGISKGVGVNNPNYGKHPSEETREKMRLSALRRWSRAKQRNDD